MVFKYRCDHLQSRTCSQGLPSTICCRSSKYGLGCVEFDSERNILNEIKTQGVDMASTYTVFSKDRSACNSIEYYE